MHQQVYQLIQALRAEGRKGLSVLLDPDKPLHTAEISGEGADLILVGGSLLSQGKIRDFIGEVKKKSSLPVVIFPGNVLQVADNADAIFFLSLISGRNPELLIGNHVISAPLLKQSGIEVIPTGYMLIDGGKPTTANYMSNTFPIPSDKPDIAACTALAGEMLGLKLIYMDAGSGAEQPILPEMVEAVRQQINIPIIVGGGIRTREEAGEILAAGADMIVVGNVLEKPGAGNLLRSISEVVHSF